MKKTDALIIVSGLLAGSMFLSNAFAATVPNITFSQEPFTDIQPSSPYYEGIEYLRTKNILKGYLDGTFKPSRRITRAEFLVLMLNPFFLDGERINDCHRTSVPNTTYVPTFSDVHEDDWFFNEICFAAQKSIINGYPDGKFRPHEPINFVEASKMMSTVLQLQVRRDAPPDERWYMAYVQELSGLNVIPLTVSRFAEIVTRGEVVEMLYRLAADRHDKPSRVWEELR